MDDTQICPICSRTMRTAKRYNFSVNNNPKILDYTERICSGTNHSVQIFTDDNTKKVDLLKLAINPNYSRVIEIDLLNQKCKINMYKLSKLDFTIDIPKIIYPDFPDLIKLQEKISLYMTVS